MIDHARVLDDLRVPLPNPLAALKGDRARQYSVRINSQWRVCFYDLALGQAERGSVSEREITPRTMAGG